MAVEKSSQTVLTLSTAIDTLNITTFFDKTSSLDDRHSSNYPNFKSSDSTKPNFLYDPKMISSEETNFQNNSDFNNSANNSTMFSDSNSMIAMSSQILGDANDSQNNNHLATSSSQLELIRSVDMLNNTVENIFINEGADINMQEVEADQHLTAKERDLIKVIQIKDVRIKELEEQLGRKDDEIANLKSHLDKFQSVFPFRGVIHPSRKLGRNIQRQRAQGISAEPQSESSMRDLLNVTFPKYEKEEQWVSIRIFLCT